MNWFKYLKFGFEKFSQLKSFSYKMPKDPEKKMYDFYMLSLLRPTGNEYIDYALEGVKETLLPNLREHLLDVVFFSICAEIRHAFGTHMSKGGFRTNTDEEKKFYDLYDEYRNRQFNPSILSLPEEYQEVAKRELEAKTKIDYLESFIQVVDSMKQANMSKEEFVKMSLEMFDAGDWEESYGGEAWANIADGWLKLYYAKNEQDLISYIDHIYDLQHNNDTVFNKLQSYGKKPLGSNIHTETESDKHRWIANALDYKAHITSPYELIENTSRQMRKLTNYNLHANYGTTEEQYYKENKEELYDKWSKVLEESPGIYDDLPTNIQLMFNEDDIHNFWLSFLMKRWSLYSELPERIKKTFSKEELKNIAKTNLETRYFQSIYNYFFNNLTKVYKKFLPLEEIIDVLVSNIQNNPNTYMKNWDNNSHLPEELRNYIESHQDILVNIWNTFLISDLETSLRSMPDSIKTKLPKNIIKNYISLALQNNSPAELLNIIEERYMDHVNKTEFINAVIKRIVNNFNYINYFSLGVLNLIPKNILNNAINKRITEISTLLMFNSLSSAVKEIIGIDKLVGVLSNILMKNPSSWIDIQQEYKEVLPKYVLNKVLLFYISNYVLIGTVIPADLEDHIDYKKLQRMYTKWHNGAAEQYTNVYQFINDELNQKQTPVVAPFEWREEESLTPKENLSESQESG